MTKKKIPKIEIRPKKNAKGVSVGANTEVLLDGKLMRNVTKVTYECAARGVAKVTLEMVGEIAIYGNIGQFESRYASINTETKEQS